MTSPAWTSRSPGSSCASRRRGLDDQGARAGIDAQRADRRAGAGRVVVERHEPARRRLALGPARHVEHAGTQGLDPDLDPLREGVEQLGRVDRAAGRGLAQARHRGGELGREVGRGPVRVDPDPDDDARVVRAETLALPQHAGELAQRERRGEPGRGTFRRQLPDEQRLGTAGLDHEVVRPLEPHGADREAGRVLGRVAHRERDGRGDPPRAVRCEPGGPEAERAQQGGAGRRGPGAAHPAAARGLLSRHCDADLRHACREPVADDVVRRADAVIPLDARERGARTGGHRHPAQLAPAAASAGSLSGRSSSKAAWRARTASSTRSSAMMVVIRISDVEIISMLIPASARVPNIRAA